MSSAWSFIQSSSQMKKHPGEPGAFFLWVIPDRFGYEFYLREDHLSAVYIFNT